LPHSEIRGSTGARPSPRLFAACHVLHRLSVPRHPPDALLVQPSPTPSPQPARRTRADGRDPLATTPGTRFPEDRSPARCCDRQIPAGNRSSTSPSAPGATPTRTTHHPATPGSADVAALYPCPRRQGLHLALIMETPIRAAPLGAGAPRASNTVTTLDARCSDSRRPDRSPSRPFPDGP
jgi:hypothetical protein